MSTSVRFIGLDVHAETIVIAVAEAGSVAAEVWKEIPSDEGRLLAELRRLGLARVRVCYEAGPTGFGLQRFLKEHGVHCIVVAPSLVPIVSGRRVKTDRRDARKLAQFLRSGDLTEVWVPDEQTEALRDLERAREDARLAERTARQQLLKFLLRHGLRFSEGTNWTVRHWTWIRQQKLSHEAAQRALVDYIHTAQQASERVARLTKDLAELVEGWALAKTPSHPLDWSIHAGWDKRSAAPPRLTRRIGTLGNGGPALATRAGPTLQLDAHGCRR